MKEPAVEHCFKTLALRYQNMHADKVAEVVILKNRLSYCYWTIGLLASYIGYDTIVRLCL